MLNGLSLPSTEYDKRKGFKKLGNKTDRLRHFCKYVGDNSWVEQSSLAKQLAHEADRHYC